MGLKAYVGLFLRKSGLVECMDKIRFYCMYLKTYGKRKSFRKANPGFVLPPAYYLYETFGLDYQEFYKSKEIAAWLLSYFGKYKQLKDLNLLDWGCGPGRVIRYMPPLLDKSCHCYGTDYNKNYIDWCSGHIPEVTFKLNRLEPPLPFEDLTFDVIYGISIFTHLSRKMHYAWFNELIRTLKPGGILFLTLHGEAFKVKLTEASQKQFDRGELVVLSGSREGHRTYAAFHPESFIRELAGNNRILEFEKGGVINGRPQQDIWIFQRPGA